MTLLSRALGGLLAASFALAASSALAAWRDDIKVLRVGVLGGTDAAYRLATLEPFRVYLQDKTGVPVEIVPAPTYDALIDAQAGGQVDYAIYSATAYATAVVKCECVEAFAAPVAADGSLGFYAILVARSGDSIADLAGADGKRLGLGPADSVAGKHRSPSRLRRRRDRSRRLFPLRHRIPDAGRGGQGPAPRRGRSRRRLVEPHRQRIARLFLRHPQPAWSPRACWRWTASGSSGSRG